MNTEIKEAIDQLLNAKDQSVGGEDGGCMLNRSSVVY